jgi:hypothetical protein
VTHDELLKAIDFLPLDGLHAWMQPALRAVVEYHEPYESKNYGLLCNGCDETPNYPCGTIRAIEKELE